MSRPSADPTAPPPARPPSPGSVRRRHVIYLSGFDPKGPAHYHRLFADQAQASGRLGGYRITVGPRQRASAHSAVWTVQYRPTAGDADSTPVETVVEFLRWDDIVRSHWPRNPLTLAWRLVRTTLLYLRSGAMWRMLMLSWPPVLALFTPFVLLIGLLLGVPAAGLLAHGVAARTASLGAGAGTVLAALGALAGLAVWVERRMNVRWLLRSYAFTAVQGTRGCPELEARLDAFADRLVTRMAGEPRIDELLVVAHSSGSIMATAVLARALVRDPQLGLHGPRLALLTLGQWSPLLSSLPSAQRFRDELARIAAEPALDWVDISAPPDGCCFALTDPVAAAGLTASRADHPRLLSPRFAALFSAEGYAALRRDRLRLHFQYLMAGERAGSYDYTAIVAGPQALGERFAGVPSVDDFRQFRLFG